MISNDYCRKESDRLDLRVETQPSFAPPPQIEALPGETAAQWRERATQERRRALRATMTAFAQVDLVH